MTVPDAEVQENVYRKLVVMVLNKRKGAKAQKALAHSDYDDYSLMDKERSNYRQVPITNDR